MKLYFQSVGLPSLFHVFQWVGQKIQGRVSRVWVIPELLVRIIQKVEYR